MDLHELQELIGFERSGWELGDEYVVAVSVLCLERQDYRIVPDVKFLKERETWGSVSLEYTYCRKDTLTIEQLFGNVRVFVEYCEEHEVARLNGKETKVLKPQSNEESDLESKMGRLLNMYAEHWKRN